MTDNAIEIDQGTGGIEIDASQVTTGAGVVNRQRIVLADNTAEQFLAILPDGSASVSANVSGSVSVLGTVNVAGSVSVVNESSGPASVSVLNPVTTVTIGNTPLPVSGSVSVIDFPATQNVAGSVSVLNPVTAEIVSGSVAVQNFPATQNVDVTAGSVGVTNFPAFPANQVVSGSVGVTNFPGNFGVSGSVSVLNPSASVSVLNPVTTVTSNQGGTWSAGSYQQGNYSASITNVVPVSGSVSVLGGAVAASVTGTVNVGNVAGSVSSTQAGYWQVGSWPVSAVNVGQTGASTAAVPVHSGSIVPLNGVIVQAMSTNAHSVFVGGSGVTTSTGFELQAGQPTSFVVSNVSLLYVVGSSSVDAVCWNVT